MIQDLKQYVWQALGTFGDNSRPDNRVYPIYMIWHQAVGRRPRGGRHAITTVPQSPISPAPAASCSSPSDPAPDDRTRQTPRADIRTLFTQILIDSVQPRCARLDDCGGDRLTRERPKS